MANPFFVDPMGDRTQGFGMLSQGMQDAYQMQQARQQQDAQKARLNEAQAALTEARNDPSKLADVMIQYPEFSDVATQVFKFTNDQTRPVVEQTYAQILADPENAQQYLTQGIEQVRNLGGSPTNMVRDLQSFQSDPEAALKGVELGVAAVAPQVYKAYDARKKEQQRTAIKPTANMQDFAEYQRLLAEDPAQAEMFARQTGILEKSPTQVKPTTAMQNFEKWQSLPEGPEKTAFAQQIGITPKDTPQEARLKAEQIDMLYNKVQSAQDTIGTIDEILNNDALGEMVGLPSAFPTIPGGPVADLEEKVEQFRNQLTLENLDKMSGVLTDRDIEVLASAASGLSPRMSEKAFRTQLNKIKSTLNRGINKNRSKLKGFDPEAAQELQQFEGAPPIGTVESGYEYIGGDPALPESWRAK